VTFCTKCGAELDPAARFCRVCGEPQGAIPPPPPSASAAPPPPPIVQVVPFQPRAAISAHTGRWISEGWNLVSADLTTWILMTLIYIIVIVAGAGVLHGPLAVGFYLAALKRMSGRTPQVGDLFNGFSVFLPTLIASLLISALAFVGLLLCIIPGLIVPALFVFAYLFVMDKRMDFWPAMQASHEVVKKDYFGFIMFVLALGAINFCGALLCGVGLLATIPLTYGATLAAYRDSVGFEPDTLARFPA
jgi:hypothetical protein